MARLQEKKLEQKKKEKMEAELNPACERLAKTLEEEEKKILSG